MYRQTMKSQNQKHRRFVNQLVIHDEEPISPLSPDTPMEDDQKEIEFGPDYPVLPLRNNKMPRWKVTLGLYATEITKYEATKLLKKKKLGVDHLLTERTINGETKPLYLLYDAKRERDVATRLDLKNIYKDGQLIYHYEGNNDAAPVTEAWKEFLELVQHSDDNNLFQDRLNSWEKRVLVIKILRIVNNHKISKVDKDYLKKQVLRGDEIFESVNRFHPYKATPYDEEKSKSDVTFLFKPKYQSLYLEENHQNLACVFTMIIEAYESSWNASQAKNKKPKQLSYEYLKQSCKISEDCEDFGVMLNQIKEGFFVKHRVGFRAVDAFDQLIDSYKPPSRNCRLTPHCLYFQVVDRHAERLNHRLDRLCHIVNKLDFDEESMEQEFNLVVSDKYYIPDYEDTSVDHVFLKSFDQLTTLDYSDKKKIQITMNLPASESFKRLFYDCNRMPQVHVVGGDTITSLSVKVNETTVEINNPMEDEILGRLAFRSSEEFNKFNELSLKLRSSLVNKQNLSSHDDIDIMSKLAAKQVICRLEESNCGPTATHYCDLSKAYPYSLMQLKKLPVMNRFDRFYEYHGSPDYYDVNGTYFYLVQRKPNIELEPSVKNTLLISKYTLYYGETLLKMWPHICESCSIIACATVSNAYSTKLTKSVIKEIMDNQLLTETQKKFLMVVATGIVEKMYNKRKVNVFLQDKDEAHLHAERLKADVFDFVLDDKTTFFSIEKEAKKLLTNGFYPIKAAIYSEMRWQLFKMYQKVEAIGGIPNAIRVDSIYFNLPEDNSFEENLDFDGNLFTNMGSYKWRTLGSNDNVPEDQFKDRTLSIETEGMLGTIAEKPTIEMIVLRNEHLWDTDPEIYYEEAFTTIDNGGNRILIGGEGQSGSGKSNLTSNYLLSKQSQGFIVLAVAPTNEAVNPLRSKLGVDNAHTIHYLLGLSVDERCNSLRESNVKRFDLDLVNFLMIDEIYLCPAGVLSHLKAKILDRYPDMKVIATGDPSQSRHSDVGNINDEDEEDQYHKTAVFSMFPKGIALNLNKRMIPEDREKMEDIKTALLKKGPFNINNIPHVQSFSDIEDMFKRHIVDGQWSGKILTYYADSVYKLQQMIHKRLEKLNPDREVWRVNGMSLYVGLELRNRQQRMIGKKKIFVNYVYIVQGVTEENIRERGKDKNGKKGKGKPATVLSLVVNVKDKLTGEEFFIPAKSIKSFVYSYCTTVHSSQGQTYQDCPISLFDFDDPYHVKGRDRYTAYSRTNRIDQAYIYTGPRIGLDMKSLKSKIAYRISRHKEQDIKADREWEEKDYVDESWVLKTLYSSCLVCPHCNTDYALITSNNSHNEFSIDRKDNRLAHTKRNCVIACRQCNVARKELVIEIK